MSNTMHYCTFEDRDLAFEGVKLLSLSLLVHSPHSHLHIYYYNTPESFSEWSKSNLELSFLTFHQISESNLKGWDLKPFVLLDMLEHGYNEAIWIDSDIIATDDFELFLKQCSDDTFITCSQRGCYDPLKTKIHNLDIAKEVPVSINSAVIRVTNKHQDILLRWKAILSSDIYRNAMSVELEKRPRCLYSDQDVLEGLLATYSEIDNVTKFRFLSYKSDIFHNGDFNLRESVKTHRNKLPYFVHAQGIKPWNQPFIKKTRLKDIQLELSPYMTHARKYRKYLIDSEWSNKWINKRSFLGFIFTFLALNHPYKKMIPLLLLRRLLD